MKSRNHIKKPQKGGRRVTDRKIARNLLKMQAKSNRIRDAWEQQQIRKYGKERLFVMQRASGCGQVILAEK